MDQSTLTHLRLQDRADLAGLLAALNGAKNAIQRDECGDPIMRGSRGAIRACDGRFYVYVAARSAKHWTYTKRALAFATVTQDGDDEGIVRLDRVPAGKDADQLRDAVGLHQTRPASSHSNVTKNGARYPKL